MSDQIRAEPPRERIIKAARKLFDAKGFHTTTTAELAAEAAVSIGQIYRLFENKDDVVLALVEENTQARVAEMQAIFDAVQRGQHSVFEAIKAIRSEEHTSELQSLMRISYAVFCLKKKTKDKK